MIKVELSKKHIELKNHLLFLCNYYKQGKNQQRCLEKIKEVTSFLNNSINVVFMAIDDYDYDFDYINSKKYKDTIIKKRDLQNFLKTIDVKDITCHGMAIAPTFDTTKDNLYIDKNNVLFIDVRK